MTTNSWKMAALDAIREGRKVFIIKSKTIYVPWDGKIHHN